MMNQNNQEHRGKRKSLSEGTHPAPTTESHPITPQRGPGQRVPSVGGLTAGVARGGGVHAELDGAPAQAQGDDSAPSSEARAASALEQQPARTPAAAAESQEGQEAHPVPDQDAIQAQAETAARAAEVLAEAAAETLARAQALRALAQPQPQPQPVYLSRPTQLTVLVE